MTSRFSNWLRRQLESRGWSQAELARRAGCTRATINGLAIGTKNPGNALLLSIARALQVSPVEAFEAAGVLPSVDESTPGFGDWVFLFLSLSESEREELLEYAHYKMERARKESGTAT